MLTLKIKKGPFTSNIKWFCPRPKLSEAFGFFSYDQCLYQKKLFGFRYQSFYTIHVNITANEETLLANCRKDTRYKIKRARREGLEFKIGNDFDQFVEFYNDFADSKNIAPISKSDLELFRPYLHITQAISEDEILVTHTYFFDKEIKRACLLHTASLFRNCDDSKMRQLIGRANRFLHFEEMLYFKKLGATIYDFGGIAVDDLNEDRAKINHFKQGFGGTMVKEPYYYSYPLYLYVCFKKLFNKSYSE